MSVTIDWGALGVVFLASFGTAVGVIVLFALGVSALGTPVAGRVPSNRSVDNSTRPAWALPVAALCFLACALVVVYGLYVIIAK